MAADDNPSNRHAIAAALQHPMRKALLRLLIEQRELSPVEASRLLEDTLSNVSYHMRKLAEQNVLILDHVGQARGVHFYVPNPALEQVPWVLEAIGLPPSKQG
jgi:DNA-binding transcriptional ArsR family regulator